jgi:predicted nucleic acid-binding protein
MTVSRIVIATDIIIDHLVTGEEVSILRRLMSQYFCYTTVFTAVELFAGARSSKERQAVDDAMSAMKVLGLNAKSAKNIAPVVMRNRESIAGLIAGLCIESGLPIVTLNPKRFAAGTALKIMHPEDLLI